MLQCGEQDYQIRIPFCQFFCFFVKLGLSYWGWSKDWGSLRTGCWGRYFGAETEDVNRDSRRLHKEEIYDLYSSPNVFWVTKSRKITRAGHMAHMGDKRGVNCWKPFGRRRSICHCWRCTLCPCTVQIYFC